MNHSPIIKSLLTLGVLIWTVNLATFVFPTTFQDLFGNHLTLETFNIAGNFISFITLIFILLGIWKQDGLKREIKVFHTALTIVLPFIFGIIFIWKKEPIN